MFVLNSLVVSGLSAKRKRGDSSWKECKHFKTEIVFLVNLMCLLGETPAGGQKCTFDVNMPHQLRTDAYRPDKKSSNLAQQQISVLQVSSAAVFLSVRTTR